MIFDLARQKPKDLALDDLTRRRSWSELYDRSVRIAHLLRDELRLGPEDHAALLMENRVEYVELTLGAILAGIWLTPINRHLQAEEVAYVIDDSGSTVVFADREHETLARKSSRGRTLLLAGDELDAVLRNVSDQPVPDDGPAGGTMIYTSGTTGRPKGVKRARQATLGQGIAAARASGAALGLDGSGPHLVTGPLYHAAPLLFAVYDLLNGAPMVIMPRWDATQALRLIQERRVHHSHLVPTMFVRLLRLDEQTRAAFDASSLHLALHGAAPISPEVKKRMIEWWGEALVEYWGATESGVCTLVGAADWLARPGTVGKALPRFEVFAVDESGCHLPAGEIGTLYCRHKELSSVFQYHEDPCKTAASYLEPGVFTIGDVGYVDADGYVYLSGRESNMIISGGVNIYPAEVEHVLQSHPSVADVGVFGIPDDEWGETVKAAIELVEGHEASPQLETEILAYARQRLAAYKVPRSIDFEDRLPRHPTGKLQTRLLRDRYWEGRGRRI